MFLHWNSTNINSWIIALQLLFNRNFNNLRQKSLLSLQWDTQSFEEMDSVIALLSDTKHALFITGHKKEKKSKLGFKNRSCCVFPWQNFRTQSTLHKWCIVQYSEKTNGKRIRQLHVPFEVSRTENVELYWKYRIDGIE